MEKPRNRKDRNTKARFTKKLKHIGPFQKLHGIRRSKALEADLASSPMDQLVVVIEMPGCRKECDVDLDGMDAFQIQGEFSENIKENDVDMGGVAVF